MCVYTGTRKLQQHVAASDGIRIHTTESSDGSAMRCAAVDHLWNRRG